VPSPNGEVIAFVSNRQAVPDAQRPFHDRDKDVWLMSTAGRWPVRLTDNQGGDFCPCWSPDGRYLMYAAAADRTASHLRVIDVSDVVAAYASGEQHQVERAAAAIRTEALPLDRTDLKAEINAVRKNKTFVTFLMPEKWVASAYPSGYFGLERYPHWVCPKHATRDTVQIDSLQTETV